MPFGFAEQYYMHWSKVDLPRTRLSTIDTVLSHAHVCKTPTQQIVRDTDQKLVPLRGTKRSFYTFFDMPRACMSKMYDGHLKGVAF